MSYTFDYAKFVDGVIISYFTDNFFFVFMQEKLHEMLIHMI